MKPLKFEMVEHKEQKKRTLLDLVANPNGEMKIPEEILDTFKRCSRKGVSFSIDNIDYIDFFDKIDFSYEQVKRITQYMENGAKVCRRKGREDGIKTYETLYNYFYSRKAIVAKLL